MPESAVLLFLVICIIYCEFSDGDDDAFGKCGGGIVVLMGNILVLVCSNRVIAIDNCYLSVAIISK